jgi:hypothetical protein
MGWFDKLTSPITSIVNKVTDDVLGFDPNGGGIYKVANNVLGDTIADDVLGLDPNGGGIVPLVNTAAKAAVTYALGDVAGGLMGGESAILGTQTAAQADAAFIAADASQLAAQGLSEAQIASTLASSGVSTGAANLAASMASNGLSEATISQQVNNLSSNTGLFSQSSDASAMQEFAKADAAQLAAQTGNNVAAIEQNLIAAGLDPVDAASLANDAVISSAAAVPGTFNDIKNYLLKNPDTLSSLGKLFGLGAMSAAAPSAPTQAAIPVYKPANTMPQYSPEYFQQIQNYYTGYMPDMPRDVATPLQDWYSQGYASPDAATAAQFPKG